MSIVVCCDERDCKSGIEIDYSVGIIDEIQDEGWSFEVADKEYHFCPEHKEGKL